MHSYVESVLCVSDDQEVVESQGGQVQQRAFSL